MRRIIFGIILVGIAVSAVAQMLWQPSAESDALFAAGVDLYNVGKYREAIPLFAKSDSLDKAQIDPSSNRRDYSSMWLASCYYKMGDTTKAEDIDYYYYCVPPVDRRLTVTSDSLRQIAAEYFVTLEYSKAIELFKQVAELDKNVVGENHIWYGDNLHSISTCYKDLNDSANAFKYYEKYLGIVRNSYGDSSERYIMSLADLGQLYGNFLLFDKAFNCLLMTYNKADGLGLDKSHIAYLIADEYETASKHSDDNKLDYLRKARFYVSEADSNNRVVNNLHLSIEKSLALCLSNAANEYHNSGNYAEAIRLRTEVLHIYEKVFGKDHSNYVASLNNLASDNYYCGNYAKAIQLATKSLLIQENTHGKEHSDYAASLSVLASSNSALGNYAEAMRLETEALQIGEKELGKKHPFYALSLSNLSVYNSLLGNYTEAMRLETEALNIRRKTLGKEHSDCALSLSNLSAYNSLLGNYTEAIRLETEALNIRRKTLDKEHPDCALSLSNLSAYNSSLGNYTEAIRLETEALQIRNKILGKKHPDCAKSLNNLAGYNSDLKNYKEAIRLGTEALNICEDALGKEHAYYASLLNNLANYNSDLKNYKEAIRLVTNALSIYGKTLGEKHMYYALSLCNLANYNFNFNNYYEAFRLGKKALNILEYTFCENHPYVAQALRNLTDYSWKIGNADAVGYCVEATEALSGIVRRTFADLTARERNLFWDKYKAWFEGTIHSIAYDMPLDSLAENGYNGALMAKGLLLNSEMELGTLLKESGDEEVAGIYNDLKNLRLQINKLYEMPVAERPLDADSLERAAQGLERQLVQRSKVYGDYTANLVIDWEQVRQRLGSGEMAVEFVSFPLRNDSVMYAAYCLRKDMPSPKMVPLFEERQLTSIDKGLYLSSNALYNLIWKPLEDEMEGVTTVYFAPSGELYNLPVENLPVDGSTYNSDLRSYRRLSSTRQLALRRDGVEVAEAAVYGGLKYDTDTVTLANDSRKYRTAEPVQWSSRAVADSLNLRGGIYELPATKIEAEEIDKALETAQIDTRLYTDTIGTEASFKALSGSGVNALHIATHGFYWTEREAVQLDGLAFLGADMPAAVKEDKALTRSGLLLAGANTALKGLPLPEGVEDGVLTAKEIAGMDLRRLDLVALSACQTGLGEITGDGVFGLQRGFKKAGANTLLMSLWKVDDTATQLLMTQFYKNLLAGMGKYEALAAAQKYLRELEVEVKITPDKTNYQRLKDERAGKQEEAEYKTVRRYADPKFWAAFVLLDGVN